MPILRTKKNTEFVITEEEEEHLLEKPLAELWQVQLQNSF
jgi:hypothetical protein